MRPNNTYQDKTYPEVFINCQRRNSMDIPRKIGIGVVMIVPTFVIAGALWDLFNNYIPIGVWVIVMAFLYLQIITGKLFRAKQP